MSKRYKRTISRHIKRRKATERRHAIEAAQEVLVEARHDTGIPMDVVDSATILLEQLKVSIDDEVVQSEHRYRGFWRVLVK
jgi:hypothetical protein